jgi:hypothetical protein
VSQWLREYKELLGSRGQGFCTYSTEYKTTLNQSYLAQRINIAVAGKQKKIINPYGNAHGHHWRGSVPPFVISMS